MRQTQISRKSENGIEWNKKKKYTQEITVIRLIMENDVCVVGFTVTFYYGTSKYMHKMIVGL